MYKLFKVNNKNISKYQTQILAHTIYNNFPDLIQEPSLKHNIDEITRLLLSKNMMGYLIYKDNKVISYLFGEFMRLRDSRIVFYINYLYVAVCVRNHGLGSRLINNLNRDVLNMNAKYILLSCDTENDRIFDFYQKKGFMPDLMLRKYSKYDILSLQLV
jgi:ribosomal protein S18 acetylase RimI-like enzyme